MKTPTIIVTMPGFALGYNFLPFVRKTVPAGQFTAVATTGSKTADSVPVLTKLTCVTVYVKMLLLNAAVEM